MLHSTHQRAAQPALYCTAQAKENLELRMKYADDPMKFLDNEVDLMGLIRGLAQVITAQSQLSRLQHLQQQI